jgi:hypothetical protein
MSEGDEMTTKAKVTNAERNAHLNRARAKFISQCLAEKIWKSLVALSATADREAAIARLRTHAVSKPDLASVVNAIAKVLTAKHD